MRLVPARIMDIVSLGFTLFVMTLTVMLSALQLISLPLNGLGNGMQPFASYNYGRGNADRLKKGIISMSRWGRQSPP